MVLEMYLLKQPRTRAVENGEAQVPSKKTPKQQQKIPNRNNTQKQPTNMN